jgi:2-polyprenyl-3-methyl-5-hydroxy-6-metoxy-1,4-benzoquinol methylase
MAEEPRPDERDAFHRTVYREYMQAGYGAAAETAVDPNLFQRYYARNYGPHLPENRQAPILEVACGRGDFLAYLETAGYANAMGVDLSEQCATRCRQRGYTCEQADAFDYLSECTVRYEAIVCSDLLEHLAPERGWRLAQLGYRALAPGGILIIKVPNMAAPLVATRTRYVDVTHRTGYTDSSLRMLLRAAGFAEVEAYPVDPYVTSNRLLNGAARLANQCVMAVFRVLYRLSGVYSRHVMSKSVLAVARKTGSYP